jgi:hypothetical protein
MAKSTVGSRLVENRQKRQGVTVLVAVTAVFWVFFIPDEFTRVLGERLDTVVKYLVKAGLAGSVTFFVGGFVYSQDPLASGSSLASRFFRHYFVTTYAVQNYSLNEGTATRCWFEYFNPWEDADHKNHEFYKRAFEASFKCRLFHYLKYTLPVYVVLAAGLTALFKWVVKTDNPSEMFVARCIVLSIGVLVTLVVMAWNRVREDPNANYAERYTATGAYGKYKTMQGILRSKFDEDVLQPGNCK